MDCKEIYLTYLKNEKKVSENTFSSYSNDITGFEEYLNGISCSLKDATKTNLLNYMLEMQSNGKSSSTIARKLASLRSFYGFLCDRKIIDENPAQNVRNYTSESKTPEILTGTEVEVLLSQPDEDSLLGRRDRALLEVLYATGMRVTELISLDVENVNVEIGFINCESKGKKRVIPIYAEAAKALKYYVEKVRPLMFDGKGGPLFLNRNGTRLSRQGFWKLLKTYKNSAKITKEITPHTLRHSFAVHLLENGADMKSIQEMLGHSHISSMQVYNKILKQKITNVYYNSHPKAKKSI
ncbi:MAG: tyrosine recombinase XerD [Ruminococcaceae bacterium]|nr:tyrosine recombinase XerD [Oscillospiraceae bacterium]